MKAFTQKKSKQASLNPGKIPSGSQMLGNMGWSSLPHSKFSLTSGLARAFVMSAAL